MSAKISNSKSKQGLKTDDTSSPSGPVAMNYIGHLTRFFEKVAGDNTLNPTHVSVYMALFQHWNCNRFNNPISITRNEVMSISKISSKATYHKCMKILHASGYIRYEPSFNPFRGSQVYLFDLEENKSKTHSLNSSIQSNQY